MSVRLADIHDAGTRARLAALLARQAPPAPLSSPGAAPPLEHDIQVAVVHWAETAALREWPEMGLLFAIPNGGHRHPATAARLKAEGVRAGVPDLCLPVARGDCHGAFLEMKRPGGQTRPAQAEWQSRLVGQGYHVGTARSVAEAIQFFTEYLTP